MSVRLEARLVPVMAWVSRTRLAPATPSALPVGDCVKAVMVVGVPVVTWPRTSDVGMLAGEDALPIKAEVALEK